MTIDALRGKSSRPRRRAQREDLAIGEFDAEIFNCPGCARPLSVGTARCPGCSTRLIADVRATKVVAFVAVGLMVGGLLGAGITAAAFVASGSATAAVDDPVVAAPSTAPIAAASAPVVDPVPVVDPAVPAAAVSGLRQSAMIDQRLATDGAALAETLSVASPSTAEIARALRALAANAAFGDRIAPSVGEWPAGEAVSTALVGLYADVGRVAREGLSASLNNRSAYVVAGQTMLALLDGLMDLDGEARVLARSIDLELAPLVLPTSP
jgi:hypothetical protein